MTKAKSKGQKRRIRKITLPGGESVPQRAAQGHRSDLKQEPADLAALRARARRTGCTVEEARDILASDDMGRCIRSMRSSNTDRRNLLTTWQAISAAWHNYATRCLSITPGAQSASLPMLPDPMQTDQSLRVDLRSADEKDAAARRVWFDWLEAMLALPADQRHAVRGHLQEYAAPVWCPNNLRPTRSGALAVAALDALHKARG